MYPVEADVPYFYYCGFAKSTEKSLPKKCSDLF
jgi:hypothetical protein